MSGYAQQTAEAFALSRACYEETEQWVASAEAAALTHAELEEELGARLVATDMLIWDRDEQAREIR